jgi:Protein of unknown function (DUF1353)
MSHGYFSGNPRTEWLEHSGPDRNMRVLEQFSFTDTKRTWNVPADYAGLNGASIPRFLWSLVGAPYVGDYRRAAIVHDYFCQTAPSQRREVDKMFYRACRAGGCSIAEAAVLYLGVRIGGSVSDNPTISSSMATAEQGPMTIRSATELEAERRFGELAQDVAAQQLDDADALERYVDGLLANQGYF